MEKSQCDSKDRTEIIESLCRYFHDDVYGFHKNNNIIIVYIISGRKLYCFSSEQNSRQKLLHFYNATPKTQKKTKNIYIYNKTMCQFISFK